MFQASGEPLKEIPAYCEPHNLMGSLANVSALLMASVQDVNWLGFYLYDGEVLRLGPFQGKPACTEIGLGKGVCGTAAVQKKTLRVGDVNEFPGHIACDSASRSEIVVPLFQKGELIGVLDVDSPTANRFTESDQKFFEAAAEILLKSLDFSNLKRVL